MTFPDDKFTTATAYAEAYFKALAVAAGSVDRAKLDAGAMLLAAAYQRGARVYVCGNGGSAAISNHMICDHLKSTRTDTDLLPRVISLATTMETLTAVANDLSYDEVFVYQLRSLAEAGDVLVMISSSGDSENIVRACAWAKENGLQTLAMTGFDGGRAAQLADINLHVAADNYGVIEDVHQSLMHILSQFIRQDRMAPALIKDRKF